MYLTGNLVVKTVWHNIFMEFGITIFEIQRHTIMDIYQIATAYWDQVYEGKQDRRSQIAEREASETSKHTLRNGNAKLSELKNVKPIR